MQDLCKKAVEYCDEQGKSIEQLAIKYATNNPRIASTLFSSSRSEAVLQNIEWVSQPFDEKLFEDIRKILKPRLNDTWLNS